REFLAPPFLWSTARSGVMTLGSAAMEMLPITDRSKQNRTRLTNSIASMVKDAVAHPVTTIRWSRDCALSAFELATQMAISGAQLLWFMRPRSSRRACNGLDLEC